MDQSNTLTGSRMQILVNSIYELNKGVRHLFLLTAGRSELPRLRTRLETEDVDYFVQDVNAAKCNIFFGKAALVQTARHIAMKPLNQMSPEEDFMLGTLLNYDKERQCQRFLSMVEARQTVRMAAPT